MRTLFNAMLISGLVIFPITSSFADVFCSSLEAAISAAPKQFSVFKGSWDPDAEFFNTSWSIDGASGDDCALSNDEDDGYSLSCDWDADSYSGATAKAHSISDRVEGCLKSIGQYKAEAWRDTALNLTLTSSKGVARSFYIPSSLSAHEVDIYVHGSCRTNKKKGTERCHAGITLDLKGDEK